MYFFIELAARAANLPDDALPKEKAKAAVLSLLRAASASAIVSALQKADVKTIANIVRTVYPGTKARTRDFLMAQLIAALIKIADESAPYKMQKVHPRRKVVSLIPLLIAAGEEFDWTKAAKNGFTIAPANATAASKDAVDLFTGEVMETITRRLKSYGITPAAYRKLFETPTARKTSVQYSAKTKKTLPKGTQVTNAPNTAGSKNPSFVTQLRVIRGEFAKIGLDSEEGKSINAQFNDLIGQGGKLSSKEVTESLDDLYSELSDLRVSKAQRSKLQIIMTKVQATIKSVTDAGEKVVQIKANPSAKPPAKSEDGLEDKILEAYRKLVKRPQDWASLTELRPMIDATKPELDAALKKMFLAQKINLTLNDDQGSLTAEDRKASIRIGVSDMHFMSSDYMPVFQKPESRRRSP